jgi:threonine aldolase
MARRLAEGLHRIDPSLIDPAEVETNIVQFDTQGSGRRAAEWLEGLKARGIFSGVWSRWRLRLVTHRHIGEAEVDAAIAAAASFWAECRGKAAPQAAE